jgi:hypothetical protein
MVMVSTEGKRVYSAYTPVGGGINGIALLGQQVHQQLKISGAVIDNQYLVEAGRVHGFSSATLVG